MDKQAKVILRQLIERAAKNRTYLIILESFYPSGFNSAYYAQQLGTNHEIWKDIYKLYNRYSQFLEYMREVKPQWKVVNTIHFADNSIEEVQENKYGEQRTVMVKSPSGDLF